jgi:hypothetical protein
VPVISLHYTCADKHIDTDAEIQTLDKDPDLFHRVIWTDEANFKLSGHVHRHNYLYWCTENPNITMETQLNQPGESVWGVINAFGVLGCIFLKAQ